MSEHVAEPIENWEEAITDPFGNEKASPQQEMDLLSFDLTNDKLKDISDDKDMEPYRNIYGIEDDKILTHKVWIKRAKVNLVIRNFPTTVHKINTLVNKLATYFQLDLHDMWLELAIHGLLAVLRKMNQKNQLDDNLVREYGALLELEQIAIEHSMVDTLTPIFEKKSKEDFEEWCKKWKWNYEKFYQLRNDEMMKLSFSKRSKMWIHDKVSELTEPMPKDDFIKCAIDQGILDESQSNAFYQHIVRLGYANKPYGYVFDE